MAALTVVDGVGLARLVRSIATCCAAHQDELNRLNVYPVPDGDTGTNMALTLESVCAEVGDATDMDEVCQAIAHGSLMGARGNSGVILSQILRGFTETIRTADVVGVAEFTTALRRASDAATAAVMHPVDGTILTVMRDSRAGRRTGARRRRDVTRRVARAQSPAKRTRRWTAPPSCCRCWLRGRRRCRRSWARALLRRVAARARRSRRSPNRR